MAGAASVRKSAGRKEQQKQRRQQQHPPRRGQLFQDRPEQGLRGLSASPNSGWFRMHDVASRGVEPVARARVLFKLRPELVQSQPLAHTMPEVPGIVFESGSSGNNVLRRGHGGANIISGATGAAPVQPIGTPGSPPASSD